MKAFPVEDQATLAYFGKPENEFRIALHEHLIKRIGRYHRPYGRTRTGNAVHRSAFVYSVCGIIVTQNEPAFSMKDKLSIVFAHLTQKVNSIFNQSILLQKFCEFR